VLLREEILERKLTLQEKEMILGKNKGMSKHEAQEILKSVDKNSLKQLTGILKAVDKNRLK
jgi:hypothetical protein